jgi:hypothetical protein
MRESIYNYFWFTVLFSHNSLKTSSPSEQSQGPDYCKSYYGFAVHKIYFTFRPAE